MSDRTITLTNQIAHPVIYGGVEWHTTVMLTGTFAVIDDVVDNYGGCLFVTGGRGAREWAIRHEDLPA